MSEVTETALNAVFRRGYERGRHECWDELKGGKRWWAMYPLAVSFGLLIGMVMGVGVMAFLTKHLCQ